MSTKLSTKHSLIRRSSSAIVVLTVLVLAVGQAAHGQAPTIQPRQMAAAELAYDQPVWETHVAMGPSRAVAVFNSGRRFGEGADVRIGFGVYDLPTHAWITQGIIHESAGWAVDGSVVYYAGNVAGDDPEIDSGCGGPVPVTYPGFLAAALHDGLGGIAVARMSATGSTFSNWWLAARPAPPVRLDKPWLVKGTPNGSELYLVYLRGTDHKYGYARSRDFGATWFPGPGSTDDRDLIRAFGLPVAGYYGPYAAAVMNDKVYMAYNRPWPENAIGLLVGTNIDDPADPNCGGVRWEYLLGDGGTPLTIARNRAQNAYANALPCMPTYGIGPNLSWPQIAVLPGDPDPTLLIVFHDTPTPASTDLDSYLVRVTKQGQYWQAEAPVLVHSDDPLIDDDQFLPVVEVDAAGRVLVVSYDDRNYPNQRDIDGNCAEPWGSDLDVFVAWSLDGGRSFAGEWELCRNPQQDCDRGGVVSPMALTFSDWLNPYYYIGEYIGIGSYGNRFIGVFNGTEPPFLDFEINDKTLIWATEGNF